MVKCLICGRIIVNEKICPTCGSALHEKNNINNDSSNNHDIKFCESCGSKVDEIAYFVKTAVNHVVRT